MPTMPHGHTPPTSPEIVGDTGRLVYPAREDTFLLLPFAQVPRGTSFLEVGTGSGLIALEAARHGARVVATDRNPHALRHLARLARIQRLPVEAVRTDLARGLGRFDRVVFNPPYLPTRPEERDPNRWHNLALDGGADGCRVAARWMAELADHLTPRGEGFLIASTVQSPSAQAALWAAWRAGGGSAEVVAERPLEGERLEVWKLVPARPRPV
ncbi:MAG: HemK2/MTQ2 family protein methyltransferase [Thermoplasmata archaeon]